MATIPASENEFPKVLLAEGAAAATPGTGLVVVYAKSDGKVYAKDDAGTEYDLSGLAAHLADTGDAHDASAVSVLDTGAHFTGTDVEAVLAELFAAIGGGGIAATIGDTKGDLIGFSAADTAARIAAAGSDNQVLVSEAAQSTGVKWAGSMSLISDTTHGSDTASFDLTSIPGTFKHLKLFIQGRSTRASNTTDTILLRFNNDSGSNYDYQWAQIFEGVNPTGGWAEGQGTTSITLGLTTAASSPSNEAGEIELTVPNYAGTTFLKACHALEHLRVTTGADQTRGVFASGNWRSTSAITRITLSPANGNWITGSRCTLYGIS